MKKKIDIEIIDKKQIPQSEPERQYYFMDIAKNYVEQLSAKKGSPLTFHVTTFGCQMNARDSEKLVGILERIGYVETDTEDADFVIYNTCTVRENANNKVYGRLATCGRRSRPCVRDWLPERMRETASVCKRNRTLA